MHVCGSKEANVYICVQRRLMSAGKYDEASEACTHHTPPDGGLLNALGGSWGRGDRSDVRGMWGRGQCATFQHIPRAYSAPPQRCRTHVGGEDVHTVQFHPLKLEQRVNAFKVASSTAKLGTPLPRGSGSLEDG